MLGALSKLSTVAILFHIAGHPDDDNYALAICKATGHPSGTVVPALRRLADRDGLLRKREQPTTTGRARIVYTLTAAGWRAIDDLYELFVLRIDVLNMVNEKPLAELDKVNASTIWILADAVSGGSETYGYSPAMRPLTHQAAYAELERMTELGWVEASAGGHRLTDQGKRAAATIVAQWTPVLRAVRDRR